MMMRCINQECRACNKFSIVATGDVWEFNEQENSFIKVKAGKRTKELEDVKSYVAKCCDCGKRALVKTLIDAYKNPMMYFDADKLCRCGGEICMEVECEKDLNAKEEDFIDGQRKVHIKTKTSIKCEKCGRTYKELPK